jgi:hypothetical protein
MVDLLQQPQAESDLDAEALLREARRRQRRRRIGGAVLAAVIIGSGLGLGIGLTNNSTPPSARGSHPEVASVPVLTDRQFLHTAYRAGFLVPGQGSVVTATIQMWSDTNSQDCFVATYTGLSPQHSTCQNQNVFQGSGGQLGVGVMNVSSLPTKPAELLRDIVTTRTGNAALDQSLDQGAPVSEPNGGPKYDRAFERVSLLLIGPTTGASPAFRTALLAVLPRLPGVRSLGQVTTQSGATGIGFSGTTLVGTTSVIVNPTSGLLLEIRNTDDAVFDRGSPVQWVDPISTPMIIDRAALPPGVRFGTPPNEQVNAVFRQQETRKLFGRVEAVVSQLTRGYSAVSDSGGGRNERIDFRGTKAQQEALAAGLRKTALFSKVTLGPSGNF